MSLKSLMSLISPRLYPLALPACFCRKDAISCPVAQLGARSVMLRIPLPEYADGTLYIVQEVASDEQVT